MNGDDKNSDPYLTRRAPWAILAGVMAAAIGVALDYEYAAVAGLALAGAGATWLAGQRIARRRDRAADDPPSGERRSGLRRDADALMGFIDRAPVGLAALDDAGRLRFVNATLAGWLGRSPSELINGATHLHDLLRAPPAAARPYEIIGGGGDRQSGEAALAPGPDGYAMPVAVELEILRDPLGRFESARVIFRDLTVELTSRAALERANDRLRRLFEDAPVGIALLDADGRFVECNRTLANLTGAAAARLLTGARLTDLLEPRDRPALLRVLSDARAENGDNTPAENGNRIRAENGNRIRAENGDDAHPLEAHLKGERPRVAQLFVRRLEGAADSGHADTLVHMIDLTERRALEAQFVQSQKMQAVGQLAGGVAHDFNNLLTAMIGFCDLLLLRHKPGDHSFSDVMQIKQNANRAANLVRQLLAFSRQQTMQPRVLDVTDVLAELANLLRRLIGETIELRLEYGRDLGLVKVDLNQLEQVIVNLAVNARDAMPGGGRLTLATSNASFSHAIPTNQQDEIVPGDYVRIDVSDTGVGIPRENLSRIFEPFFSTKEVGAGTGLGLSTVYGIVRQTGGFVMVDSAPGEGARFSILLPRHQGEAPAPAEDEARSGVSADLTGSATVLLVEDEDAVRVFSARALRNKGYQVVEAKNGESALTMLTDAGADFDLLITDVVMPQMDGPTLARKARDLLPNLRVIFISGYAEDRVREDLGGVEGSFFLPKPFSLKQLAAKVKDVLRRG